MSFTTKQKYLDDATKDLVNGYLRELKETDTIIPPLVLHCCLRFYFVYECFADIDKTRIYVSNNKRIIKSRKWNYWQNTCFGERLIISKNQCVYHWKLKLLSTQNEKMKIGLGISNCKNVSDCFFKKKEYWYSRYNDNHAKPKNWAFYMYQTLAADDDPRSIMKDSTDSHPTTSSCKPELITGDIVHIHLDLSVKCIIFTRIREEKENLLVKFNDVECKEDLVYRLSVALYGHGDGIEIIEFH